MNFSRTFLVAALLSCHLVTHAQELSLRLHNVSVKQAMTELEHKSGYSFVYEGSDVNTSEVVTVNASTLTEAVSQILAGQRLHFEIKGKKVIISRADRQKTVGKGDRRRITGLITDEQGEPIIGATVKEQGTGNGTISDLEGRFSLEADSEGVLQVSYVGFATQELPVSGRRDFRITLREDNKVLSEVVVIGYGTQRKGDVTSSVGSVKSEDFITGAVNDAGQLIQGKIAGLSITNPSGNPVGKTEISLRGNTTILGASTNPLILIDGVPGDFNTVAPEDIESIDVLKDGSAAAIYGSRGANGIIVITSREPEEGRLRLSYNGQMNVELPDLSGYHLLDARRKLELEKQLGYFEGSTPDDIIALSNRYASLLAEVERGVDTDWLAKPLRAGIGHRHALRIEGGDKAFRYAADVSADFVNGVMKGSGRRNYNGGITLNYQKGGFLLSNRFLFGYSLSDESPYGSFADYVKLNPYWTPTDENGAMKRYLDEDRTYWGSDTYFPANPLYNATLPIKNTQKGTSLTDNLALEYRFSPAFTLRGAVSLSKEMSRTDHYLPRTHTTFLTSEYSSGENVMRRGRYDYGNTESTSYTVNLTLNYNKLFGGRHLLYLGVNGELSEQQSESVSFELEGFTQEDPKHLSAALSYAKNKRPGGSESTFRRVGVVANANYSLSDTYYVDGAYRVEGASQFGANKRFAPFYSIGAGWNLHRERWMQSVSWVSYLKLRLSYGQNGSQRFSPYQAIATYNYLNADRYHDWLGIAPAALENEDLEWQITDKYNVGVEASFFKARVNLTADVYCDVTDNLLTERTLPLSNGFTSYSENLGKLRNVGFEAKLSVKPIVDTQRRIIWTLTGSVAHNKSKMVKLSSALKKAFEQEAAATRQLPPNRLIREGEDLNTLYAVRSLGIDPQNGREVYVDRNGELTYTWSAADLVPCGVSQPKFRGNLNSTFRWGNFSCALAFGYHFGGQQYNETLVSRVEVTNMKYNVDERVYTGRWKQEGDVAPYKGLSNYERTNATSRFVQDDRMLTLRNVNLAYEFREQVWMKALGLTTMQVSANLSDVFYLSSIKRERGLSYPFARRGSLALSLMF